METALAPGEPPTIAGIRAARERLGDRVRTTPVWQLASPAVEAAGFRALLKLELFQVTGSFKPRGALMVMLDMTGEERDRGVVAVSAGNHAIAVAYAARVVGTTAKVVMPRSANPARVAACRRLHAEVVHVDDVHAAFLEMERIERAEGRLRVHPFEGPKTALGTATLGLELCEQLSDLDAVVVPIGGGGLCAGVAAAVKQLRPRCAVYGVEPEGADSMSRSFAAGRPERIDRVRTIADSLGAPHALPYSFALCRRYLDDLVKVDDDALCRSMAILFADGKLAVEPAGAAAAAAALGPLRPRLAGKSVALVVCGANIDAATFAAQVQRGAALASE
jgi:threonine dehydratase